MRIPKVFQVVDPNIVITVCRHCGIKIVVKENGIKIVLFGAVLTQVPVG